MVDLLSEDLRLSISKLDCLQLVLLEFIYEVVRLTFLLLKDFSHGEQALDVVVHCKVVISLVHEGIAC